MTSRAVAFLSVLFLALLVGVPSARAALVSTDQALAQSQINQERSRVKALVERPEIAKALEKMGITERDAQARVDAMSNDEVRSLAGRIDALPAGGQVSDTTLLLAIIVVLLLVIAL